MRIAKIKYLSLLVLSSFILTACVGKNPQPAAGVYPTINQAGQPVPAGRSPTPTDFLERNGINVVRMGDIVEIIIPADKIFLANSTEVKFSGEPFMFAIVNILHGYGYPMIHITAYTDNIGTAPHKMTLSQLWAQSAATYLWAHGVPLERIHFKGEADSLDIASRRTAKGSYYNRRVEILFWAHASRKKT